MVPSITSDNQRITHLQGLLKVSYRRWDGEATPPTLYRENAVVSDPVGPHRSATHQQRVFDRGGMLGGGRSDPTNQPHLEGEVGWFVQRLTSPCGGP